MIIRMRKDAGPLMVRRLAEHFLDQGQQVFVENTKGKISLAVFNLEDAIEHFSTDGLIGIETTRDDNQYFVANRDKFVPAQECFAKFLSGSAAV